jgi:hypothetical protein
MVIVVILMRRGCIWVLLHEVQSVQEWRGQHLVTAHEVIKQTSNKLTRESRRRGRVAEKRTGCRQGRGARACAHGAPYSRRKCPGHRSVVWGSSGRSLSA